jgi:peroxiredoxin
VIGVGYDTPTKNLEWSLGEGFTFELWSDTEKQLDLYYGAVVDAKQARPSRVTKILDSNGVLVLEYVTDVVVGAHPAEVLADCKILFP